MHWHGKNWADIPESRVAACSYYGTDPEGAKGFLAGFGWVLGWFLADDSWSWAGQGGSSTRRRRFRC
jgi:hypothetical protein